MPPGIVAEWNENNIWAQAQLIGYEQIREQEEVEIINANNR